MTSEEMQELSTIIFRLGADASRLRGIGLEGFAEDLEELVEQLEDLEAEVN